MVMYMELNVDEKIELEHLVEEYRYSTVEEREAMRKQIRRQLNFNKKLLKLFDKVDKRGE